VTVGYSGKIFSRTIMKLAFKIVDSVDLLSEADVTLQDGSKIRAKVPTLHVQLTGTEQDEHGSLVLRLTGAAREAALLEFPAGNAPGIPGSIDMPVTLTITGATPAEVA
jgi:hypothetical protein